jgi:hypothetical protein
MPDWEPGVAHSLLRADRRSRCLGGPHLANALKAMRAPHGRHVVSHRTGTRGSSCVALARTLSDAGRPRSGQRRGRPARHSALVAKEIDYRGAFRFDTEFDESIALLAGSTALDPVITHSFDLVDAVAAMDVSAEPAISGKVVLRLSDD